MRALLVLSFLAAIALVAIAIGIEVAAVEPSMRESLSGARDLVSSVGRAAWGFAQPLIQLVVVLLILEWLANRSGLRVNLTSLKATSWNVQTFIAGIIITTFCIAALANIQAVAYLKEVVLIVIGFYFGTRASDPDSRRDRTAGSTPPSADAPTTAFLSDPPSQPEGDRESGQADRLRGAFDKASQP